MSALMQQTMSTTGSPNHVEISGYGVTPAAARHIVGAPTNTFNANDAAPAESVAAPSVSSLARQIVRAAMSLVPGIISLDKSRKNSVKYTATGAIERRHGYALNHDATFAETVIGYLPAAGEVLAASRNLPTLSLVEKVELLVELALNEQSLAEAAMATRASAPAISEMLEVELPPCEAKVRSTRRRFAAIAKNRTKATSALINTLEARAKKREEENDIFRPKPQLTTCKQRMSLVTEAIKVAEYPTGYFVPDVPAFWGEDLYDEGSLEPGVSVIATESGAVAAFCELTGEEMAEIAAENRAKRLAARKERARHFSGTKGFPTGTTLSAYISH